MFALTQEHLQPRTDFDLKVIIVLMLNIQILYQEDVEVHISNIHKRESFRHYSYVSQRADSVIVGCGVQGYELALLRLVQIFIQN